MLHHLSLGLADLAGALPMYDAALAALGYERVFTDLDSPPDGRAVGYGLPGGGDKLALKQRAGARAPGPGFHLAVAAPNRAAVRAFHEAALRHGARCNGAPGLRPHYGAHYYAAFVRDAEGHEIEAVINTPAFNVRHARRGDVAQIQRVRHAVRENRLVSRRIEDAEVQQAIEGAGRGWVAEGLHAGEEGKVLGFAIANGHSGQVWALFVDPVHEAQGVGCALHAAMMEWLLAQGLPKLWLSTDPGTRAEAFYRRAGWRAGERQADGELRFDWPQP